MTDLAVQLGALRLKNPVMPASGTFSAELGQVFDLERLGAIVLKTIRRESCDGNPLPRVAETRGGMLNSIGIPSKGLDDFLAHTLPAYASVSTPLVVSLSASTPQAFATLARDLSRPGVAALEINLSCPNIEQDGRSFAMSAKATYEAVRQIRAATRLPLWVKLTPNTGEIATVAMAAEDAGANALVVANTLLAMAIDVCTFRFRLGNITGGLSGPAVKPIVLRQVYQATRAVRIPVIGCGGISSAADVIEYMLAGAAAVQVGTATFLHPAAMPAIVDGIEAFCRQRGIARLSSIVGQARPADAPAAVFQEVKQ
ncbi:MAG: dihydroorotate dehydrogenase [Terracidiphilus sp.]|nr:dihydroorotate dehydrogenase [Terracidiphilus sp.]